MLRIKVITLSRYHSLANVNIIEKEFKFKPIIESQEGLKRSIKF
jgi:hypothetical protein